MNAYELRDLDEARRFLCQGLWWQQAEPPTAATVRAALEWWLQLAASGRPLPPVGFVADLGHLAFRVGWEARGPRSSVIAPNLPVNLLQAYEDQVLGKIDADWTFDRSRDALRAYKDRDRARGLAFVLDRFQERAGFPGVTLSPGVIKHALQMPPEEVLNRGYESLRQDGLQPLLADLYEALIAAVRRAPEMLGPDDLFELEAGTALDDEGPRLERRQVLRAAHELDAGLPARLRLAKREHDVPTRILDEDTYPVGGFTSLSNRGSIESLLHSQLAYMETDEALRPDLFDVKFLRDELLYYARDENRFLRRRRTFVFVLDADLVSARFKDPGASYQRIVYLLALVVVLVRKLGEWLTTEALTFDVIFLGTAAADPLAPERDLLRKLLRDQVANGTVRIDAPVRANDAATLCGERARRSLCQCLWLSVADVVPEIEDVVVMALLVDGSRPRLDGAEVGEWGAVVKELLQRWV